MDFGNLITIPDEYEVKIGASANVILLGLIFALILGIVFALYFTQR